MIWEWTGRSRRIPLDGIPDGNIPGALVQTSVTAERTAIAQSRRPTPGAVRGCNGGERLSSSLQCSALIGAGAAAGLSRRTHNCTLAVDGLPDQDSNGECGRRGGCRMSSDNQRRWVGAAMVVLGRSDGCGRRVAACAEDCPRFSIRRGRHASRRAARRPDHRVGPQPHELGRGLEDDRSPDGEEAAWTSPWILR